MLLQTLIYTLNMIFRCKYCNVVML